MQGTSLTGFYLQRGGRYDGNDPSHRLPTEGYTDVTFPCNCFLRGGGRVSPSSVVFFGNIYIFIWLHQGFPDGSDGKESDCNAGDLGSIPGSGRFPWRREWQPTPVFLPGESLWTLAGYSPWGCRVGIKRLTDTRTHTYTHLLGCTGS